MSKMSFDLLKSNDYSSLTLEEKVLHLEGQVDSLKSSRNYYKDQCESLLISLKSTVNDATPSYRTQKEVEEMINGIKAQESEKNKRLKVQFKEREDKLNQEIESLQQRLIDQEKLLEKQSDARTDLVEQLMEYKKQLNISQIKQREAEQAVAEMKSGESSSVKSLNSSLAGDFDVISSASQTSEIKKLKRHLLKIARQYEDAKATITLTHQIQEDVNNENELLRNHIKSMKDQYEELQRKCGDQQQQINDSRSLLKNAISESMILQSDIESSQSTIMILTKRLASKESEFSRLNHDIISKMLEINRQSSVINSQRETINTLRSQNNEMKGLVDSLKSQMESTQKSASDNAEELMSEIRDLKSKLQDKEVSEMNLNSRVQKQQTELMQEVRLRKAAEVAKEAALTNLKNAYSLLNTTEITRNEISSDMDRMTSELEERRSSSIMKDQTIEKLTKQVSDLNEELKKAHDEKKKLQLDYNEITSKLDSVQKDTISKEEATRQIETLMSDREMSRKTISQLEDSNQTLTNELNELRAAFSSQEESLMSMQNEIRNLTKTNMRLRSKLINGETVSEGELELLAAKRIEASKVYPKCAENNSSASFTISSVERTNYDELSNEIKDSRSCLRRLLHKMKDMIDLAPDLKKTLENIISNIKDDTSLRVISDYIEDFLMDYFSVTLGSMSHPIDASTEAKLLRSSIQHLNLKVKSLKEQNQLQEDEISKLQNSIQNVFSAKGRADSQYENVGQTISSLRISLDSAQKSLLESERQRRRLEEELSKSNRFFRMSTIFDDDMNISELNTNSRSTISANNGTYSPPSPRVASLMRSSPTSPLKLSSPPCHGRSPSSPVGGSPSGVSPSKQVSINPNVALGDSLAVLDMLCN